MKLRPMNLRRGEVIHRNKVLNRAQSSFRTPLGYLPFNIYTPLGLSCELLKANRLELVLRSVCCFTLLFKEGVTPKTLK